MKTLIPTAVDLPLMDRVHAMTFAAKLHGTALSTETRRVLATYRSRLRSAERFVIDDEAVRLTCHLSHEIDRLPGWSFLARLPYPVMWLEFDAHMKMRVFEEMGTLQHGFSPDEVSPVVGYLLYKDLDSDSRWIAHEFKELSPGGEVYPGLIALLFDPEADGRTPVSGSKTWNSLTFSRRPGFPKIPVRIQVNVEVSNSKDNIYVDTEVDPEFVLCGVTERIEGTTMIGPEWFTNRGAGIVDPFWENYLARKNRDEIIATEIVEQGGVLRWLVTLLATINGIPRMVKPINIRPGRRTIGMHTLPYLRHANLNLEIPRDDRIVWVAKRLDREVRGRRLAWHPVIGHWRIVEYGRSQNRMCRHVPVMVENGLGMCERCGLLIRWIELPNGRGDPAIGMVDHTYRVSGRRQPRPPKLLPS